MEDCSENQFTAIYVPLMAEELQTVMAEQLGQSTVESESHVRMYAEHQYD